MSRAGIFALLLLILSAALLPMRVAMGWAGFERLGLSARSASGSIWHGRFREARLGAMPLGDVDAWISPWSLLTGRVRLGFAGAQGIDGTLTVEGGRYRLDLLAESPDRVLSERLARAGFIRRGSGFALRVEGAVQPAGSSPAAVRAAGRR